MALAKGSVRLNNTRAVTRILQRIINDLLMNEQEALDIQRLRAAIYACSVSLQAMQQEDIEGRIGVLEEQLKSKKKGA